MLRLSVWGKQDRILEKLEISLAKPLLRAPTGRVTKAEGSDASAAMSLGVLRSSHRQHGLFGESSYHTSSKAIISHLMMIWVGGGLVLVVVATFFQGHTSLPSQADCQPSRGVYRNGAKDLSPLSSSPLTHSNSANLTACFELKCPWQGLAV